MNKEANIFKHLKSGKSLSKIECIMHYHYINLGGYINKLRNKGYNIVTTMVKCEDSSYAEYRMVM